MRSILAAIPFMFFAQGQADISSLEYRIYERMKIDHNAPENLGYEARKSKEFKLQDGTYVTFFSGDRDNNRMPDYFEAVLRYEKGGEKIFHSIYSDSDMDGILSGDDTVNLLNEKGLDMRNALSDSTAGTLNFNFYRILKEVDGYGEHI